MSRRNGGIIGPTNTPVGGLTTGVAGGVWRMNDVLTFVSNNQWPKVPENIENSCRFNNDSSDYLIRTPSSASNRDAWTLSLWIKRCNLGTYQSIYGVYADANNQENFGFDDSDRFFWQLYQSGGVVGQLTTNRIFRDTSAWYHIVAVYDSENSTAGNRMRLYINSVEETSFATDTNPSSGLDSLWNSTTAHSIGRINTTNYVDMYLAEFVHADGQVLDPTSFGETDSTTGIWKPRKIGQQFGTVGTNGFYLDFKDSSNLGNDASGLNNDFTVNNLTSVDQGTDTCVVNYATMNSLAIPPSNAPTFAEGNLKISTDNTNANPIISTMGVSQGKWYAEAKRISYDGGSGDDDGFRIGFGATYVENVDLVPPGIADSGHYFMIGTGTVYNGSTDLGDKAGNSNISDDGVVGIALDLDNSRISWSFNGAWMTGSNAWSGSSPSSYVTIESGKTYFFLQTDGSSGRAYTAGWNFGGQSAFTISSGNSDANGFGNFEYPVPSGYYALNTTNLNTYG